MAVAEYGMDGNGQRLPGFMTHFELVRELATATGERRAELVKEARTRMKQADYPRFPAVLGITPE